jgi:Terminase RNaseH-like domain
MTLPSSPTSFRVRDTIRRSPVSWARACKIKLRPYQIQIANAIKDSIINDRGLTFVVILPRQSGKNELQAHLFAWLLFRYARRGGRIVSVSPTFKPQTQINMRRVKFSLDTCVGSRGRWKSSDGYLFQLGNALLQFFSGEPRANVLGATADLLLSVDEAQSISILKFDRDFDPMTASTNATRIFWGTALTSSTLLERERRIALQAQQRDGIQRLFYFTADDVRQLVPAYDRHVERILAEHGRNHPLVCSQYYGEIIDAQSGMFTPARLALINADQIPATPLSTDSQAPLSKCALPFGEGTGVLHPDMGVRSCAFLLDIAGMDESRLNPLHSPDFGLGNPGRDSTALSIVQIDLSTLEFLGHPTYHVVARHSWVGENHLSVFGKLKSLAETWHPQHILIDATGVGEGLWALLDRAFPSRVTPVKFTQSEKSEIGWRFLSIIETGRFRDHFHTDEVRLQYSHCIYEILPGPLQTLRWGVPDGTRGPDGELIHDDFILADSLVARLDALEWRLTLPPVIVPGHDPLSGIDRPSRAPGHAPSFGDRDYDHTFGSADYDHGFGVGYFDRSFGDDKNVRYHK